MGAAKQHEQKWLCDINICSFSSATLTKNDKLVRTIPLHSKLASSFKKNSKELVVLECSLNFKGYSAAIFEITLESTAAYVWGMRSQGAAYSLFKYCRDLHSTLHISRLTISTEVRHMFHLLIFQIRTMSANCFDFRVDLTYLNISSKCHECWWLSRNFIIFADEMARFPRQSFSIVQHTP
jgi:hypothetical protein